MTLELSKQEAEVLARILDEYLAEFHEEIVHTDRRDLRARWHESYDQMKGLKGRVEALISPEQPHA